MQIKLEAMNFARGLHDVNFKDYLRDNSSIKATTAPLAASKINDHRIKFHILIKSFARTKIIIITHPSTSIRMVTRLCVHKFSTLRKFLKNVFRVRALEHHE
jgi:hypothetical protein